VLPKVDKKPTFEDIQITNFVLIANAISYSSMSGWGFHGHLGIIIAPVECTTISNTLWAGPCNPGPIPLFVHGTEPLDTVQLARLRDEFRRIYTNNANVYQALKRIILDTYDDMYTSQLEE
jgi:hypothetical protein